MKLFSLSCSTRGRFFKFFRGVTWDGHCWDLATGNCIDCPAVLGEEK